MKLSPCISSEPKILKKNNENGDSRVAVCFVCDYRPVWKEAITCVIVIIFFNVIIKFTACNKATNNVGS